MNALLVILFGIGLFSMFNIVDIFAETITLFPTDDAFVGVNLSDLNDPVLKLNTGDRHWFEIWYYTNSTEPERKFVSLGHLKFDLSELNLDEIKSATLNLKTITSTIQNNILSVFQGSHSNWNETSLVFTNKPAFNAFPIDSVDKFDQDWIQFNVTNALQSNSTNITFVISLDQIKPNFEEGISFHSKDSTIVGSSPFLEIELNEFITPSYTVKKLFVIEDAYVSSDYDPQDIDKIQSLNTGSSNFPNNIYNDNFAGSDELAYTVGFLKFDLDELISEKIIDAKLWMFNSKLLSTGGDKIISIYNVTDDAWTESEIYFENKPELLQEIAFTEINNMTGWNVWDVTDTIKENAGSTITLSPSYSKLYPGHVEQVIFNSKESGENIPYLEIIYDEPDNGGGCLIATATYGSELAPQVQQLRELRDNHLLQTETGSAFMESFNSIYYSFSPTIADLERQSPIFKEIVRLSITPLVSSLSILNYVDMDSEESVLGYGISLILFNLGVYFVAPAMLFWNIKNYLKKN